MYRLTAIQRCGLAVRPRWSRPPQATVVGPVMFAATPVSNAVHRPFSVMNVPPPSVDVAVIRTEGINGDPLI